MKISRLTNNTYDQLYLLKVSKHSLNSTSWGPFSHYRYTNQSPLIQHQSLGKYQFTVHQKDKFCDSVDIKIQRDLSSRLAINSVMERPNAQSRNLHVAMVTAYIRAKWKIRSTRIWRSSSTPQLSQRSSLSSPKEGRKEDYETEGGFLANLGLSNQSLCESAREDYQLSPQRAKDVRHL